MVSSVVRTIAKFAKGSLIGLCSRVGKVRSHQQTRAKFMYIGHFLGAEFSEQWLSCSIICVCVYGGGVRVCSPSLTNKGRDIDVPFGAEKSKSFILCTLISCVQWHPLKEKFL